MVTFFQKLFKIYHYTISPLLGARCRYAPTCSEYGQQALQKHGLSKGLWLTTKRVCRCHPWGGHGYDPVPECDNRNNIEKQPNSDES